MLEPVTRIDLGDYTEFMPACEVIAPLCFIFNIAEGFTVGLILYPRGKVVAGNARLVEPGLWALAALSLMFFIFYPYG